MKKKIILLVSTLLVGVFAINFIGCNKPTEGLAYELNEDGLSYKIVGMGEATDTDILIPDESEEFPITEIGYCAFSGNEMLNSIKMSDNITKIGTAAFSDCISLKQVTFSKNLTIIGGSAFYGCEKLTDLSLETGVTSIEDTTFAYCSGLKSIRFPDELNEIGYAAFSNCISLVSVTFPDNLAKIDNRAFDECSSLAEIVLPKSCDYIGNYAFANCDSLQTVYYKGDESDERHIKIRGSNSEILNAKWCYFSEEKPIDTDSGIYWHYVHGAPKIW